MKNKTSNKCVQEAINLWTLFEETEIKGKRFNFFIKKEIRLNMPIIAVRTKFMGILIKTTFYEKS